MKKKYKKKYITPKIIIKKLNISLFRRNSDFFEFLDVYAGTQCDVGGCRRCW